MRGDGLVAESVHDVGEPVAGGIHVGVVDLVGIAGEDDLRAVAVPIPDSR